MTEVVQYHIRVVPRLSGPIASRRSRRGCCVAKALALEVRIVVRVLTD